MNADPTKPGAFTVRDTQQRAAQLLEAGESIRAFEVLQAILPLDRRNGITHAMLGDAAARASRLTEAARYLRTAADLMPADASVAGLLANAYSHLGETGKAHRTIDAYLKHHPPTPLLISIKARLFQSRGDNEAAHDLVARSLDLDDPTGTIAAMYGSICRALRRRAEGIDHTRRALERLDLAPEGRRSLFFTLGHLLDAEGEYDQAFECFERGNNMLDAVHPSPPEHLTERWTREYLDSVQVEPNPSDRIVMIVGMPRSGTTLTEQVIAAHPAAAGVGESDLLPLLVRNSSLTELPDGPTMRKIADGYAKGLASAVQGDPQRIADKLPGNYMFLGIIAKALPNARIVHCRRDPRDSCLSCYFQDFGYRQPFTRRQETVAKQFLTYHAIMEHWRQTLDLRLHDSVYEDLTADPRPHVESLIAHVGLPWNDACLEPHKAKSTVTTASIVQVRRPIYQSSRERWRRYEKHIGPMLEILENV